MSDNSTSPKLQEMSLENMLIRLQEIQKLLEEKKVSLSASMPLIEEAFELKKLIETELAKMENKLQILQNNDTDNTQSNI